VREFRKRGEIALSRDVVTAAALTGGTLALLACSGMAANTLLDLTRNAANASDGAGMVDMPSEAMHSFLVAAAPVMLGAGGGAVLAMLAQLGWPPAFKKLTFDLGRISPFTNLKNTFSFSAMSRRTGAALAKMVVVGAIVVMMLRHGVGTHSLEVASLGSVAWTLIKKSLWLVIGALGGLAAVDYYLARRKIMAQMRMTPDEARREHKEQEGDPVLKGKRKARMRELAKRRMAVAVAKADVVVVNPTHYAVALRYDETKDAAPIVFAKGIDESAEKIREVARQHGVPVLSRPPLARALHKHVKEGRPVPSNLFRAVAEVLAYVYRIRRGGRA